MTLLSEAKELVYQRFVDNFTGVPLAQITFENEELDTDKLDEWVRLTVRSIIRSQNTLGKTGNRKFRSKASVFVQLFVPANTGVNQAGLLAEEAANIFEGVSFSGLDFQSSVTREGAPDKKWYPTVVEIEFDFDEIK